MRADAGTVPHNLRTLFGSSQAPCDTQMRDILDPVEPSELRPAFRTLHGAFQRGSALKDFAWLDAKYLLAVDGTDHFFSGKVSCPHR